MYVQLVSVQYKKSTKQLNVQMTIQKQMAMYIKINFYFKCKSQL